VGGGCPHAEGSKAYVPAVTHKRATYVNLSSREQARPLPRASYLSSHTPATRERTIGLKETSLIIFPTNETREVQTFSVTFPPHKHLEGHVDSSGQFHLRIEFPEKLEGIRLWGFHFPKFNLHMIRGEYAVVGRQRLCQRYPYRKPTRWENKPPQTTKPTATTNLNEFQRTFSRPAMRRWSPRRWF